MGWAWEGGRGGYSLLLLALVMWPVTTHSLRGGTPFLLLAETPAIFRHSLRV